jgi:phosphate/sulfate permease
MDKIALVKKIAKPVVGFSVSFAVGAIVRNNVLPKNRLQEVELMVASVVIGMMVADFAERYAQKTIDNAVAAWHEFKQTH